MITAVLNIDYHVYDKKKTRELDIEHHIDLIEDGQKITLAFPNWYDASEVLRALDSNAEDITTIDKTEEE